MHIAKALDLQQVMLLRRVIDARIGEKQQQIHLVVGDPRAHLLLATLGPGQVQGDWQARGLSHKASGGGGGGKIVLFENALVCDAELDHQFLLLILRHDSDIQSDPSRRYNVRISQIRPCLKNNRRNTRCISWFEAKDMGDGDKPKCEIVL